jgi:hypothetical protein
LRFSFGAAKNQTADLKIRLIGNYGFGVHACRWLVALLLFGQFALAAGACTLPIVFPAAAYQSSASCHDEEGGSANLCLAHCLQGDQTLDSYHGASIAAPPRSGIQISRNATSSIPVSFRKPLWATGPPASIRFCSLQL